jgi:serine/threonine protein kinase
MDCLNSDWIRIRKSYKLIDVLGEGSYGKVVLGKHRKSGKKVAIKFI